MGRAVCVSLASPAACSGATRNPVAMATDSGPQRCLVRPFRSPRRTAKTTMSTSVAA